MHTFSILIEDEDGRCQAYVTSSEAEELIGGVHGTRNILLAVRRGNETCLKLRGREIDAPIEHPVEELLEPIRVATLGRLPIHHRIGREEEGKHRTDTIHSDPFRNFRRQLCRALLNYLVDFRMRLQIAEHCNSGAHGHRIAGESSSLIDRSQWRDLAHDIGTPTVGRERKTSADALAERRVLAPDPIKLLRATQRTPDSSHAFTAGQ